LRCFFGNLGGCITEQVGLAAESTAVFKLLHDVRNAYFLNIWRSIFATLRVYCACRAWLEVQVKWTNFHHLSIPAILRDIIDLFQVQGGRISFDTLSSLLDFYRADYARVVAFASRLFL